MDVIKINMLAATHQLRVSAQLMIKQPKDVPRHLMVVNSWAAMGLLNGQPGLHGYYGSKAGIMGVSKVFWNDLREFGIKMTSIYPGLIDNELGRRQGPFRYNYTNIISSEACADALLFALDAPEESCITHMVLKEQYPFADSNQKIIEYLSSKL